MKNIRISIASMRLKFHKCDQNYIWNICKGRCCFCSKPIMVAVAKSEEERLKAAGATLVNGFVCETREGRCPFQNDNGFCNIHDIAPAGCRFSPFKLNKNGVLLIKNRNKMLACYKAEGDKVPVYEAHYESLKYIIGDKINDVITIIKIAKEDFFVEISDEIYNLLMEQNAIRQGRKNEENKD